MKRTVISSLVTILIFISADAIGQPGASIMKKALVQPARVANDVAQDKAEEEAEKQITKAIMEGFGLNDDTKYDQEYKFDAWFSMQITNYKKNGKVDDQVEYDNYVNKGNRDYGMQYREDDTRSTILYDADRLALIILTNDDGEKTGFATRFDPGQAEESADGDDYSDLKPLKTGNTKKILGYTCDEYLVEDEGSEARMWISEKLGKEISKEMLSNPNAFGTAFQYSRVVDGMILEYDLIDTDSGEKTELLVTDLDLNRAYSISTGGYHIITMNLQE